ncbi:MAG: hypothetical protein ACFFE8_05775 [Candidatus Heimdallarchaeota archaeon]
MSDEPLDIDEIIPTIERVKSTLMLQNEKLVNMRKELETKETEIEIKEKEIEARAKALEEAHLHRQQLEFDYMNLENELKKISELYQEMTGKEEASLDVKQLLGIYIALLEKVFAGQPHAKILYLLHGDKSEMTREELTKASGVSAAVVLHSIHELNRAELVTWDEEAGIVKLSNRIFE